MRLLVTGGAGFIGSTFVRRRLESTRDEVTVLDKLTYAGDLANLADLAARTDAPERYRFVHGDIADADVVADLVREMDAVVNFAAESHVDRSILEPTAFLVDRGDGGPRAARGRASRQRATRVMRPLPPSVDGRGLWSRDGGALSRDRPKSRRAAPTALPRRPGSISSRAYRETHGLDTVITRGANTYGPSQNPEKLIPLFVTNALLDLPLPMYGDGMQRRDWLYVDDHADGVGVALDKGAPGAAYNVPGEGVERPNREVTQAILAALDKPWSLVRQVPDRPGHDRRYALDGTASGRSAGSRGCPSTRASSAPCAGMPTTSPAGAPRATPAGRHYQRQYGWRLERSVAS